MRDWFTFHQTAAWVGTAYWRVRAIRSAYGTLQNGQPITSYGPWSPVFQTHATPPTATQLTLGGTTSDVIGTVAKPAAHKIMPGFSWSGNTSGGIAYELYRVYVFSDDNCVEPVLTGSIVGSPAWVPRLSGPLALPGSLDDIAKARSNVLIDGAQTAAYDFSRALVTTSETMAQALGHHYQSARSLGSRLAKWCLLLDGRAGALADQYAANDAFEYQDTQAAQDACAAGRISRFGKVSQAVPTAGNNAFVTSLSLSGKMTSAAASRSPRVYGSSTLVTWTPALAADELRGAMEPYELSVPAGRKHYHAGNLSRSLTDAGHLVLPSAWDRHCGCLPGRREWPGRACARSRSRSPSSA